MNADYYKHETAIVDEGAEIGKGSKVWHWVHISGGAKIGDGCVFGQNVFVGNRVRLGKNVKVQNNVSIYDNVYIEDDVFCGPSMVFTNVINPRSEFVRKDEYRDTHVRKGATIGANATIICGAELGEYCFIAAGAVVKGVVPPYAMMAGVPAKQKGWMSRFGEKLELPVFAEGIKKLEAICEKTGDRYTLEGAKLTRTAKV